MPQWPTDFFENDNYKIKRRKVESIRKRECKRTLKMPHKKALKTFRFYERQSYNHTHTLMMHRPTELHLLKNRPPGIRGAGRL